MYVDLAAGSSAINVSCQLSTLCTCNYKFQSSEEKQARKALFDTESFEDKNGSPTTIKDMHDFSQICTSFCPKGIMYPLNKYRSLPQDESPLLL